ncbi:MAG: hypothetical protein ACO3A4_10380 [Silvanigrellaceae bacterium]
MNPRYFSAVGFLLTAAILANGCRPSLKEGGDSQVESIFYATSKLRSSNVSVCWEVISDDTQDFRSEFQSTVSKAFAKTKLRFTGWGACPDGGYGADFRIFIYDDPGSGSNPKYRETKSFVVSTNRALAGYPGHPRINVDTANAKNWLLGRRAGIILSMTGRDASPYFNDIRNRLSAVGKKNLMISSSLHEFGHAIGMRHEDAHSDNKCVEFDENPQAGDRQIGPWNPTSFMERCFYRNFDYEKGIVWPNQLDIDGINKMYSALPAAK